MNHDNLKREEQHNLDTALEVESKFKIEKDTLAPDTVKVETGIKNENDDLKFSKSFVCPSCSMKFVNEEPFMEHVKQHYNMISVEQGFYSIQHQGNIHRELHSPISDTELKETDKAKIEEDQAEISRPADNTREKLVSLHDKIVARKRKRSSSCDYQNQKTKSIPKKQNRKLHKCSECEYESEKKSNLTRHMLKHSGEKLFQCSKCSYKARQKTHLDAHEHTHNSEKAFKCPICPHTTNRVCHLKQHMLTHEQNKTAGYLRYKKYLYSCSKCSFQGKSNRALEDHLQTHTLPELLHQCPQCPYSTSELSDMEMHERIHKNNLPFHKRYYYPCSECPFLGKSKIALENHLQTHITPDIIYPCPRCPYKTSDLSDMELHERIHKTDQPWPCLECPYVARQQSQLVAHQELHNREEEYYASKFEQHAAKELERFHIRERLKLIFRNTAENT